MRNRATGEEEILTAGYFIIADGANGRSRETLGIGRSGVGALQHWMNIVFETDMPPTIGGKRFASFFATDINGAVIPREGGRWLRRLARASHRRYARNTSVGSLEPDSRGA